MLTALILVCSLASVPDLGACTEDNALQVLRDPEAFVSPVACFVHGQAYLAGTALGRDLSEGEAVKVVCARSHVTAGPSPAAANSAAMIAR
jgi:hypothetical protein